MWSARSAHWRYRCEVKAGASPVFTSYLTTWLRELCEWIGFYSGERWEQWRGFKQSLEQLRDTGVLPRQGEVRINAGLSAWWQTHTECFTQDRSADTRNWQREAESRPKRPRQAGPGVLQGAQDLIAELVAKGYRIVYTDGSSKRLSHKDMRRAGGFGVFATEDEQGPEVRFCGYVPTRHRQTNNGAVLWAALEALQGFRVPKLAILTDSQYLQLRATGKASTGSQKGGRQHPANCRSTCPSGKCCSRKWQSQEEKSGGSTSQHMSTCRGMRWRMDWRWKACAPARCGPNKSHSNCHPGRSPRWG